MAGLIKNQILKHLSKWVNKREGRERGGEGSQGEDERRLHSTLSFLSSFIVDFSPSPIVFSLLSFGGVCSCVVLNCWWMFCLCCIHSFLLSDTFPLFIYFIVIFVDYSVFLRVMEGVVMFKSKVGECVVTLADEADKHVPPSLLYCCSNTLIKIPSGIFTFFTSHPALFSSVFDI